MSLPTSAISPLWTPPTAATWSATSAMSRGPGAGTTSSARAVAKVIFPLLTSCSLPMTQDELWNLADCAANRAVGACLSGDKDRANREFDTAEMYQRQHSYTLADYPGGLHTVPAHLIKRARG